MPGVWRRRIPTAWGARTDVYEATLNDHSIRLAVLDVEYAGLTVILPMDDLRRAVAGLRPRTKGQITFTMDVHRRTINKQDVAMVVLPATAAREAA